MSSFAERRLRRASMPVRVLRLGEEELVDPRDTTSVDERVALVWTLTLEQWAQAGLAIPDYERASMPGRVSRPA